MIWRFRLYQPALARFFREMLASLELIDIFFFVGLWLLGYGLEQVKHGAGFTAVGFILVLYVKPLQRWIK